MSAGGLPALTFATTIPQTAPAGRRSRLKRLIQREIENPLSLQILEGTFVDGDTIAVDVSDNGEALSFHKVFVPAPATTDGDGQVDGNGKDDKDDRGDTTLTTEPVVAT